MTSKKSRRHDRIWKRLISWYGARFGEQFGESMPEDWRTVIDATDDARLDIALINARRASPLHPMTLGLLEASIPKRQFGRAQNIGEALVEHGLKVAQPCKHQLASSWPFFARETQIVGMTIPPCVPCEKQAHRFRTEDLTT